MKCDLRSFITSACFLIFINADAQSSQVLSPNIDTVFHKYELPESAHKKPHIISPFVIPVMGIAYGLTGLENHGIQNLNFEIKEELYLEHAHNKFNIDNYLQFFPAVAVYGLNALDIHGKNNFIDRTGIYLLSNLMLNSTCQTLKRTSHVDRPDGSAYTSFPSGHTAEAFASAEFLRQEYRDVSKWYGIAGYAVAVTTGYMRMYNNKHWLSDVVAGAGIGIISTKISYWIYPGLKKVLFKRKVSDAFIMPSYNNRSFGVGFVKLF